LASFQCGPLKGLVIHSKNRASILHRLGNDLAASLRIPPQLGFDQNKTTVTGDEDVIKRAATSGSEHQRQFAAQRHQISKSRLDLLDWENSRLAVQQGLQPRFVVGAGGSRIDIDATQGLCGGALLQPDRATVASANFVHLLHPKHFHFLADTMRLQSR
jgi:hypothetical protein